MINGLNYLPYAAILSSLGSVITHTAHDQCWTQVLGLCYYYMVVARGELSGMCYWLIRGLFRSQN
jgi:hypothetical protein